MSDTLYHIESNIELVTSFQDADPMGVIYHGNYFRFFEEARRVLMEKLQYNYLEMKESGYMWPVIDTRVKYVKAIPFNHAIKVSARLTEWENRLRVDYQIHDAQTGARMCKAHTTQVAVEMEKEEMCFVSPKAFTDKVEYWHQHGCLPNRETTTREAAASHTATQKVISHGE